MRSAPFSCLSGVILNTVLVDDGQQQGFVHFSFFVPCVQG